MSFGDRFVEETYVMCRFLWLHKEININGGSHPKEQILSTSLCICVFFQTNCKAHTFTGISWWPSQCLASFQRLFGDFSHHGHVCTFFYMYWHSTSILVTSHNVSLALGFVILYSEYPIHSQLHFQLIHFQ